MTGQELREFLIKQKISAMKFIEISGVSKACIFNFLNGKTQKLQFTTEGKVLEAMNKIESVEVKKWVLNKE